MQIMVSLPKNAALNGEVPIDLKNIGGAPLSFSENVRIASTTWMPSYRVFRQIEECVDKNRNSYNLRDKFYSNNFERIY